MGGVKRKRSNSEIKYGIPAAAGMTSEKKKYELLLIVLSE